MAAYRTLSCLIVCAASLWGTGAGAQETTLSTNLGSSYGTWLPGGKSYLGLSLGRPRYHVACATTSMLCDDKDRPAQFYAGRMLGDFWGAELSYLNMGRLGRDGVAESRAQGLNLSVLGKAQLGPSLEVFGKVGTTYSRTETAPLAAITIGTGSSQGFGLSWGGGVSYEFSPRLSAKLEWESHDMRFGGGGRDPLRSTSLGLQYRY